MIFLKTKKTKSVSIRIDEVSLEKTRYISAYEGRSINGQILHLIHKNIREFEKEHGEIKLEE